MDSNESDYTARELMVCAAARLINDGEQVFVGMRLPMIAFQLAVSTHAPNALSIFESGVVRDDPAEQFLQTMCDLSNLDHSLSNTGMMEIMSRLQRGQVDIGFLGGAEIDRYGNLNTTRVLAPGEGDRPDRNIRLPGSGGAADMACMAGRTIILMPHQARRFVNEVHYVTSPGYGSGGEWREANGLPGGGPQALVTSKAVFGFDDGGEMVLDSLHPGVEREEIEPDFPWDLQTSEDFPATTEPPSEEELTLIRRFDPDGFWTR